MGLLNRKPRPGSEVRITHRDGSVTWGIYEGYFRIGSSGKPPGHRINTPASCWDWQTLEWTGGKVTKIPDGTIPRKQFRAILAKMGLTGMSAEEMALGLGATDEELDQFFKAMQEQDTQTLLTLPIEVGMRRAATGAKDEAPSPSMSKADPGDAPPPATTSQQLAGELTLPEPERVKYNPRAAALMAEHGQPDRQIVIEIGDLPPDSGVDESELAGEPCGLCDERCEPPGLGLAVLEWDAKQLGLPVDVICRDCMAQLDWRERGAA